MNTLVAPGVPMRTDLKLAGVLAIAGALAVAALFPYLMVVMPQLLAKIPASIPLSLVVLAQTAQGLVFLGVFSFLGLRMGHPVGLGAPWLTALIARTPRPRVAWALALTLGLLSGVAMIGLDTLVFLQHMPAPLPGASVPDASVSAGVGFLASFYGGLGEELQARLLVMTGVVFALWLVARRRTAPWMYWSAIIVAALAFGAGHLPTAAAIWPLDSIVVSRIVLVNAVGGLLFGWLYWKRGLEAAMIAHFGTDLVLHVFAPLLAG